jgi:hypothetical protein
VVVAIAAVLLAATIWAITRSKAPMPDYKKETA